MSTKALAKSYHDEYLKIKNRGSVWLKCPTGWFHTYNKDIVKLKMSNLYEAYWVANRGN